MTKLSIPIVCEYGFNTMDPKEAIQHIRDKHPELLEHEHNWSVMVDGDWFCSTCGIGMSELEASGGQ